MASLVAAQHDLDMAQAAFPQGEWNER
jgi:hypothetical protein